MKKQKGFTLVEFLIVMAVIGIVVGITVPALLRARAAANTESFSLVDEPLAKHLELRLNDKVIDVSKPQANWIPEDQKTIVRPFVAQRLKAVCENASAELAEYQKVKQDILTAPLDDKHVGMDRRLELLVGVNRRIAYLAIAVADGGTSCMEATRIAGTLDLLPK